MREAFHRFASKVSTAAGRPGAFVLAAALVVAWAMSGPLFHFSDTWQLLINTSTTVATFLMVFLIQATQNRQDRALHLKLDELIRSNRAARNSFTCLEEASEEEMLSLQREFIRMRAEDLRNPQREPPVVPERT